jgi:hypothetical protein
MAEVNAMPIIEPYILDHNAGPRNCQYEIGPGTKEHPAELILHSVDGRFEKFLCKRHAAMTLSHDLDQLATAVVESALALEKTIHI